MSDTRSTLPVLDLEHLAQGGERRNNFLQSLRHAAHEQGFFYLSGHGVSESLNNAILEQSARFFALPEKVKDSIAMIRSPHFRGYNREGLEYTRGQRDWREQVDIGAERVALPLDAQSPAYLRLQGPNQWPSALPEFRPVVLAWQEQVTGVLTRVLRALALSLGQDEQIFGPVCDEAPHQLLKLIRYPARHADHGEQGVGPHKDSGLFSLILQDEQSGLEVETAPGQWTSAPPRKGTFVVNIAELLEVATGGYLRASVHRVVSPPPERERLSVAFFLGARLDAHMPILHLPEALATATHGVTDDPSNPLFSQVGLNALKGRLRSHPDVAARYHADLLDVR
jgi:isopenicillin N synthase-like dioxygenase